MAGTVYKFPNGTLYPSTQFLLGQLLRSGADPMVIDELGRRFMRQAVENMELRAAARHAGITLAPRTHSPQKEG